MKKLMLIGLMGLALVGCNDGIPDGERYANILRGKTNYINPHDVGNGYVQYEIERGAVTCREHSRRAELTCWKNGSGE